MPRVGEDMAAELQTDRHHAAPQRRSPPQVVERILRNTPRSADQSLLVYVHVPFCNTKCTFCHWMSPVPVRQMITARSVEADYTASLCAQIAHFAPVITESQYRPTILYWGGGTPTKLGPDEIRRIGNTLQDRLDLDAVEEYTVESSPDTLTTDRLRALEAIGVDRLSIGVQSFDDEELRTTARAHTGSDAIAAYTLAREIGFENINIDLLAALPGQPLEVLERSLQECVALAPEHVSVYIYNNDPRTVLARQIRQGKKPGVTSEHRRRAYLLARQMLLDVGYIEYMPMYFAREPSRRFAGEEYYFKLRGDSFGFGSGAHSTVAHHLLENAKGRLHEFIADPLAFDQAVRITADTPALYAHQASEALLFGDGLGFDVFEERFGFPLDSVWDGEYFERCRELVRSTGGVLEMRDGRVKAEWQDEPDGWWKLLA
jgi:coproporphyrinogen III oxidase-like Fe-S oxidoreductase